MENAKDLYTHTYKIRKIMHLCIPILLAAPCSAIVLCSLLVCIQFSSSYANASVGYPAIQIVFQQFTSAVSYHFTLLDSIVKVLDSTVLSILQFLAQHSQTCSQIARTYLCTRFRNALPLRMLTRSTWNNTAALQQQSNSK